MATIVVAGAQMVCRPADERGNLAAGLRRIEEASAGGASLVILPELFATGYDMPHIRKHTRPFPDSTVRALGQKAAERKIFVIAGLAVKTGVSFYNAALLWDDRGNLLSVYKKSHLMSIPGMMENRLFKRGRPDATVVATRLGKIGMMVCFDLRFPELARKLALNGAEVIAVPSAWAAARKDAFAAFVKTRALENQLFVFGVNRAGKDGPIEFAGGSMLCGPSGAAICKAGQRGNRLLFGEIDRREIRAARKKLDVFGSRHPRYGL